MPTEQDVKFSDFIRGLPAAAESDLSAGNNMPIVSPSDIKKMGGENVAKDSLVKNIINKLHYNYADFVKNIDGYFVYNQTKKFMVNDSFVSKVYSVKKGDFLFTRCKGGNGVVAEFSFFTNEPDSSSTAELVFLYEGNHFCVAPIDGYCVISKPKGDNTADFIYPTLMIANTKDEFEELSNKNFVFQKPEYYFIHDYYVRNDGVILPYNGYSIKFTKVRKDDVVFIKSPAIKAAASFTYFEGDSVPTKDSTCICAMSSFWGNIDISPVNGWVCTTYKRVNGEVDIYIGNSSSDVADKIINIEKGTKVAGVEKDLVGVIDGYYIDSYGTFRSQAGFKTKYYAVAENEFVVRNIGSNSQVASMAFFDEVPTISSKPIKCVRWTGHESCCDRSPVNGYCAVSWTTDDLAVCEGDFIGKRLNSLYKKYFNKTCMYIGDSISTSNDCFWKGYLEDNYKLKYARNPSSGLWAANGGIRVIPNDDDDTRPLTTKSIWYRCCNSRLSHINFDIICLFGGTNDIGANKDLGSISDVPYTDESSFVENPTFAQCLMGCIEMLQRDFPGKEIILPTVMPMRDYGNYTIDGQNATQAYAEMQLKIANKYGLKCVWLFDGVKTIGNSPLWCKESAGVHPNQNGALRVMARFAETLSL